MHERLRQGVATVGRLCDVVSSLGERSFVQRTSTGVGIDDKNPQRWNGER